MDNKKFWFAAFICTLLCFITFGAFFLPDAATYVTNCEVKYTMFFHIWATIGTTILMVSGIIFYFICGLWLYDYFTDN